MIEEKQKSKPLKSDFIRMFSALEGTEKDAFEKYIVYFYGQYKSVLDTFELVSKAVKNNDENSLFSLINNEKKTLNNLSDLKKWLIEFITVQEIKNNSFEAKFLTLEALRKRKMKDVLAKRTSDLRTELSHDKTLNNWQSLMTLGLDHAAYFNTSNDKVNVQAEILQLIDGLDNFFIQNKLKYCSELEQRSNILQEIYEPRLLNSILDLIENDTSLNAAIYELHLPIFMLGRDRSDTAFSKLKNFLSTNQQHDSREKLAILIYLLNFTAYQVRNRNASYNNEFFDLVETFGVKQSLFIVSGYFPTTTFMNVVNVSTTLEKHDWAKQFVDKWSQYLVPEDKEIATNLVEARILFCEKEFEKARKLLESKMKHQNIAIVLNTRILLAQVFFEQNQPIIVQHSHCDNLNQYVLRNKSMNKTLQESTINFVKVLRLLIDKKSKTLLVNELENKKKVIFCNDWLSQKIDKIK
jgi:hypothetical protein